VLAPLEWAGLVQEQLPGIEVIHAPD